MERRLTFSTYPTLQNSFKERCNILGISMGKQLELLISKYITQNTTTLSELHESFAIFKSEHQSEKKNYKFSVVIDADLYAQLQTNLYQHKIRPASFLTLLIAYFLSCTNEEYLRLAFAKKAQSELENADENIKHIVYALTYNKPSDNTSFVPVHKEFFLDFCTDELFHERYQLPCSSGLITVWAVHR